MFRASQLVTTPNNSTRHFMLAMAAFVVLTPSAVRADLIWEDHFTNNDTIINGAVVNTPGIDVTVNTTVIGNATAPRGEHFLFRTGPEGTHTGYMDLNMDTDEDNRNDELQVDYVFGGLGVDNLQFSVLDIDTGSWDDGVEIQYTTASGSGNVRDDPSLFTLPTGTTTVFLDNEANLHGFEGGFTNSTAANEWGNLGLDFTGLTITSVTIKFFSTDDAASDPGAQFIGVSDFIFTAATPEPSAFLLMLSGIGGVVWRRPTRRSKK